MEKQENSTKSQDVQAATESRYVHPMEQIERWFDEFMPRGWMSPLRRNWDFPNLPDIHLPFEGKTPRVDIIERDGDFEIRAFSNVRHYNVDDVLGGCPRMEAVARESDFETIVSIK